MMPVGVPDGASSPRSPWGGLLFGSTTGWVFSGVRQRRPSGSSNSSPERANRCVLAPAKKLEKAPGEAETGSGDAQIRPGYARLNLARKHAKPLRSQALCPADPETVSRLEGWWARQD